MCYSIYYTRNINEPNSCNFSRCPLLASRALKNPKNLILAAKIIQDDHRIIQDDVLKKRASENPKNSIQPPRIIQYILRIVQDNMQNLT
ncbi:hypothetical protein IEQ34_015386 [Dendrobium chrysotoxum]|uniref:Uncharacterized protein n=1 Tax=Dendrobium chrysotoxum TaxID=161865 RepID=A0AAV7G0H8_DENCH|nr:hypothetical protein IEQ34_015386 [Dendrobium chrysotoxum]